MSLNMIIPPLLRRKRLITNGAFERFHVSMYPLVHVQIITEFKRFRTNPAFVSRLGIVREHVLFQPVIRPESFRAQLALEPLFFVVHDHVSGNVLSF